MIAPHTMCTAQKSAQAFDTIAVAAASMRLAKVSCPRGRGRVPIGEPAASRKRARARPWNVSS